MRTTLTIDDELYRRTRLQAAAQGRSVGSVVEDALRAALASAAPAGPTPELPTSDGSLLPGVDLDDTSSLEDLMARG